MKESAVAFRLDLQFAREGHLVDDPSAFWTIANALVSVSAWLNIRCVAPHAGMFGPLEKG